MRKNKSKLMAFSLLALCFACLGFGVYALKNANMTVTGTVGFTAHDCMVKVVAEIEGDGVDANNVPNSHGAPSEKRDLIINKTENSNEMVVGGATEEDWNKEVEIAETIWFTDLTEDGKVSEIVMTFTLTNQSAYPITASIANAEIANVVTGVSEEITIAEGAEGELTATFNLNVDANGEYPEINSLPFEVKLDFEKAPAVQAPKNVVLDTETNILTFVEADGATGYEVAYFKNGEIVSVGQITGSGQKLKSTPIEEGDYVVKVRSILDQGTKILYSQYVEADQTVTVQACTHLAFELSETNSEECVVSGIGQCTDDTILIPATYNGIPVVGIKTRAFYNEDNFTNVIIPEGVTNIGQYAFSDCDGLEYIHIPSTVTTMENHAFVACSNMRTVNVANELTWLDIIFRDEEANPLYNGADLAVNNSIAKDVVIPDGSYVKGYVFSGCESIESLVVSGSVQNIATLSFRNCKNLKSVRIEEGIKTIGEGAFWECVSLVDVNLPSTLKTIYNSVFAKCTSLKTIDLPSDLTDLKTRAFSDCTLLETIIIPDNIVGLIETFQNCTNLKNVTLPANLQTLNAVFTGCTSLVSIDIPEGVTSFTNGVFSGCTSLESIKLPSTLKTLGSVSNSVPAEGEFYKCYSLKHVEIPSLVTNLGRYTFDQCTALESVIFPEGVKLINNTLFSGNTSLQWVIIPSTTTIIQNETFYSTTDTLKIFYAGTQEKFNTISDSNYNNIQVSTITKGSVYYYSETSASGNYWHYVTDETGKQVPTVW